jgi:DEAD/DEAH box helicase domain-containing protein
VKADHNEKPTIFFYDRYPGGIGLSEKIYSGMNVVFSETKKMIDHCQCQTGCPSCIGTDTVSDSAKNDTLNIIDAFLHSSD